MKIKRFFVVNAFVALVITSSIAAASPVSSVWVSVTPTSCFTTPDQQTHQTCMSMPPSVKDEFLPYTYSPGDVSNCGGLTMTATITVKASPLSAAKFNPVAPTDQIKSSIAPGTLLKSGTYPLKISYPWCPSFLKLNFTTVFAGSK